MPDTGWVNLNVASEVDNPSGTESWSNKDNAKTEDGFFAFASWAGDKESEYLKLNNLISPGIPVGANIDGIEARIKREQSGDMYDASLRLVVGGTISGDDKADTGTNWPTSNAWSGTYGGPTDTWGLSLTQAQVDANDFGIVLATAVDGGTARVDVIQIKVYYSTTTQIEATLNATSSLAGALSADVPIVGALNATSGLVGLPSVHAALVSQLDATSGLAGFLRSDVPISAQLDGASSLSADFQRTLGLFADLDASSYLAGTITADVPLAAALNASSGLDGFLKADVPIAAQLDATSGLVAEIHFNKAALVSQLNATSGLAGFLRSDVPIAAQLDATSGLVADLRKIRQLNALLDATSGLDGSIEMTRGLAAELVATSGLESDLTAAKLLSALLSAESGFLVRLRVLGHPEEIAWVGRIVPVHSWKGRIE